MDLPLAVVERVMRTAGADRIEDDAVVLLKDSSEKIAREVAGDTVKIAQKDGREKVTREDVDRAIES